jgi:hypothetical protein
MNLCRVSPQQAPVFLASKWLHIDLLVDADQMKDLFSCLLALGADLALFSSMGLQPRGKNALSIEQFLAAWQKYIETLQSGNAPQDADFRFFFTAILTGETKAVKAIDIQGDKEIITPCEPVVQIQLHRFIYSSLDQTFRSMIFGRSSVSWGVRFSYPQVFQYPHVRHIEDALDEKQFVNARVFSSIRQWVRKHTMPTPFVVDEKRVNVPIRIGKECLSWINGHAELIERNIKVEKWN